MTRVKTLFRFLLGLNAPVNRRAYALCGFSLAAIKYLGDVVLFELGTGHFWKPTDYLLLTHSLMFTAFPSAPGWLLPALGLWALLFLWMGLVLTMRRAIDAGRSPWWMLGFFVPYLNYVLMAAFCLIPSSARRVVQANPVGPGGSRFASAFLSVSAGIALGLAMVIVGVALKAQYGFTLFFGAPFAMGALTAFLLNRRYPATMRETIFVTHGMFFLAAGALFLFAFEGAICIVMAIPLGLVVGLLGAAMGRAIALWGHCEVPPAISAMLLLPLSLAIGPGGTTGQVLHEVRSSVVINCPPDRVWPQVIAFPPIPEPSDLVFRLGIAYPSYARIEGSGVGAVRYCVFSTGAFVEPITDWEPGTRLGFDVASSPPPLKELSLYANVAPPHLRGYLRSRRGEFRLIALPGNRTRLEGSTWYQIDMGPEAYWQLWSDFLIHRIHNRVLDHIRRQAEGAS